MVADLAYVPFSTWAPSINKVVSLVLSPALVWNRTCFAPQESTMANYHHPLPKWVSHLLRGWKWYFSGSTLWLRPTLNKWIIEAQIDFLETAHRWGVHGCGGEKGTTKKT